MVKDRKKVIIIGGGFGGISAAKGFAHSSFEVFLFDRSNHHLFQPLLYQVASAALSSSDIAVPIREILSSYKNITVLMENVESVEAETQHICTDTGERYYYDYLIIATGAKHSYFGHPEWEKLAPGLKTLEDAMTIRNNMLNLFEEAEKKALTNTDDLNLVVIGGGPTGVEMAGALAEIATKTLINDFRRIDSSKSKVYLVEGAPQILGMYPPSLAGKAQAFLERLGVTVLLNSIVTDITEDKVVIGDQVIKTKNVVWAAGNHASPLLKTIGEELDRAGRAVVQGNCAIEKYSNIFVIGDAAHFKTEKGDVLPGLAPVATQQGHYVAKFIQGEMNRDFSYFDKGSMATVGKFKAILQKDKLKLSGFSAWLAWGFVHILFLINFRSKVAVFTHWAFSFFFSTRGVRLIIPRQRDK